MYRRLLGMNASDSFGESIEAQICMMRQIGFEAFFTLWSREYPIEKWAALAREQGLIYQSLHAPFGGVADIWHDDGERAENTMKDLTDCIRCCSNNEIEIMVSHCYIGFDGRVEITDRGLERYGLLIDEAERLGVKIAFENTEGEEYLEAIFDSFGDRKSVGFCLDTGHEMCYNYGKNLLDKWGDKLIATHINDNLGIRDYNGRIFWHDDLHLLPFDGIRDWDELARRISKCGYEGILTFEMNKTSKPGRHENDRYERMSLQEYFTEVYSRACRFASKL